MNEFNLLDKKEIERLKEFIKENGNENGVAEIFINGRSYDAIYNPDKHYTEWLIDEVKDSAEDVNVIALYTENILLIENLKVS